MLCMLIPTAQAQWVKLEACGQYPDETRIFGPKHFTDTDTISHYWIWVPAIIAVKAYKGDVMTKMQCSSVMIQGRQILVKGTDEQTIKSIRNAK